MNCKAPKAAVRILLSLQMLLFGLFSLFGGYIAFDLGTSPMAHQRDLWSAAMILSALGIMLPCFLEMYVFHMMSVLGHKYRATFLTEACVRFRPTGYALAGCVWSAIWYIGILDDVLRALDFLGVVYVLFVIWLQVLDAQIQRRVHNGNEKRRPFVSLY